MTGDSIKPMRSGPKRSLGSLVTLLLLVGCGVLASAPLAAETIISVSSSSQLSQALATVPHGGIIELENGTYPSPSGGFLVFNPGKSFTLRAVASGGAVLDGGNVGAVFRLQNTGPFHVVFEGLVFANGFSQGQTVAGGVTLIGASAVFRDCTFRDNLWNLGSGGGAGGGVGVQGGSTAVFVRCQWLQNRSQASGAGMLITDQSTVWVHDSRFFRNRSNVPGHSPSANGGGINAFIATLRVTNTRFQENEAVLSGGAISVRSPFGETFETDLVVANSTFVDNKARPAAGEASASPSVGGALMIENYAQGRIFNSRFDTNTAKYGGALSAYRSIVTIEGSAFRGNVALGTSTQSARGGAIHATSNDSTSDSSNYRSADLTIRDSLLQGRYGGATTVSQLGGCVYADGDPNRMYGLAGVTKNGTLNYNRLDLVLERVAFVDCDIAEILTGKPTFGGALFGSLVDLIARDTIFVDSDAVGGRGGAAAFITESLVDFTNVTFADNSADEGGALGVAGSTLAVSGSTFFDNQVPGASASSSLGASIFTTVQKLGAELFDVSGRVKDSFFLGDFGLPIYEDDRSAGTGMSNLVDYVNNEFAPSSFGTTIFYNKLDNDPLNVAGLNVLVVENGHSVDKAPLNDNVAVGSGGVHAALLAAPAQILDQVPMGDAGTETPAYLAWAWTGACARLDGVAPAGSTGVGATTEGVHGLMVFDNGGCSGGPDADASVQTTLGPSPAASLVAQPLAISGGESADLGWSVSKGRFIEAFIDHGVGTVTPAAGSISVSPTASTSYMLCAVTKEGGASVLEHLYVDESPPTDIFADGFESGSTAAWSTASP